MRFVLTVLAASVGWIAFIVDRRSHGRYPPQPRYDADQRPSTSHNRHQEANGDRPDRPVTVEGEAKDSAAQRKRDESDTRHKRGEVWYWRITGTAAVLATVGTLAAAAFAYGAYDAALESVAEARRQADIAQQTLVASTRARLKLTAITDARATRSTDFPVAWFTFKPTFKNFGQTPAQNIAFSTHVFVIGTGEGQPARDICEGEKTRDRMSSGELAFPQEEGGESMFGIQMPISDLTSQAAKIEEIQTSATIYLGVVGCLTYQTIGSPTVYVTGFSGDLHLAQQASSDPADYVPVYDMLIGSSPPVRIEMKISNLRAWAD